MLAGIVRAVCPTAHGDRTKRKENGSHSTGRDAWSSVEPVEDRERRL